MRRCSVGLISRSCSQSPTVCPTPPATFSSTTGSTDFFIDWESITNDVVALLRAEAGRDPYGRALTDLIGERSTRSEEFRFRWAAHSVRFHRSVVKNSHHPGVGDLTLIYEALELPGDPGQSIFVYMAEPNSGKPSGPVGDRPESS